MSDQRFYDRARRFAESVADVAFEQCVRASRAATDGEMRAGLYAGAAGMSMLFAALERKEETRELLSIAAGRPFKGTGLFGGLSGVLLAARYARECLGGYEKLTATLDEALRREIRERFSSWSYEQLREKYDLAYGLAGELAALGDVPSEAVAFIERWQNEDGAGQWATRALEGEPQVMFGMSHGLAGWLGALSQVRLSSWPLDTRAMCGALVSAGSFDRVAVWGFGSKDPRREPQAWCHGTPGVAMALFSCGVALADESLVARSSNAIQRSLEARGEVDDHTLCHGLTGLATIALATGVSSAHAPLIDCARAYFEEVFNCYDPAEPLAHVGDSGCPWGLFRGISGMALAALTAAGGASHTWWRALGIPVSESRERGIGHALRDRLYDVSNV